MTAGNLQANSITKRIHQVIANLICTFELDRNYVDEDDPQKGILVADVFYIRSIYYTTNKKSPGQLVFGRDMVLPIEHVAYWRLIYQRKQTLTDKNAYIENITRTNNHFKVDDQALIKNNQATKYETL